MSPTRGKNPEFAVIGFPDKTEIASTGLPDFPVINYEKYVLRSSYGNILRQGGA